MINYNNELVKVLDTVLPTYYEMTVDSKTPTPCITYMETNNYSSASGTTFGYSYITYQIKVWGNKLADIQRYALEVDAVLRPLGFKRIASRELYDNNSTMIQKIMSYEALASEDY